MKRKLLIATLLLAGIAGMDMTAFSAPNVAGTYFEDVPRGHWAYSSMAVLNSQLPQERQIPDFPPSRLITRYEFAVFCARAEDFLQKKPELSNSTIKDIMAVFNEEFDYELSRLGCPEPLDCKALGHGKRHDITPRLTIGSSVLIRRGYTDEAVIANRAASEAAKPFLNEAEKTETPAK